MNAEEPKRIFGYARISSDSQVENTSLGVQAERIRAWAESRGWVVAEMVSDVASGSTLDREGLNRLRNTLGTGDAVVVYKLDRLSRSVVDAEPLISSWEGQGIGLHSVTEPLDTSSAMGRAMFRMVFVFAQAERETIAERMVTGKAKNAADGKFNGSPIPYGYRRGGPEERDFEIVPDQAEVIRELFRHYSSGKFGTTRLRKITGCPLSESGIADLLSNVFYTGRLRYSGQVRFNNHAAIVSDRLFNRCQRVKAQKRKSDKIKIVKLVEGKEQIVPICLQRCNDA
jgi:site-specific DNA recombinase